MEKLFIARLNKKWCEMFALCPMFLGEASYFLKKASGHCLRGLKLNDLAITAAGTNTSKFVNNSERFSSYYLVLMKGTKKATSTTGYDVLNVYSVLTLENVCVTCFPRCSSFRLFAALFR